MANSKEIMEYKRKAMKMLVNDPEIVKLINNLTIEYPDDLIGTSVLPYMKVLDTENETNTYIFITVDMTRRNSRNDILRDLTFTITVTTHVNTMSVPNSSNCRTDMLAARVDELFNGNDTFGVGKLQLNTNHEMFLDKLHACRILKFSIQDINYGCVNYE